jgi:uncharacterized protein
MSEILLPFNIMCKPVCGVCNLDCSYCYYTMKPRELYPHTSRFQMSEDVLELYTRQYLEAMPTRCEFGWQGGEPTLAGLDFFRKAIDFQKQYGRDGQLVANALQTNGTLLTDEWCEFLAEARFLVGISLDGPAQWHDHFRRDHSGQPSFHRAWAGLELLEKHHVEYNVLVTLNSVNAPHAGDIYRFFVNRGVRYLQFIPILERDADGRIRDFSCTAEQFGRFQLDVFEQWASRDIGKVSERFLDNLLHKFIYDKASMCCYADRCANAHVLEWNGDLYACDHFVYAPWRIGNITERPLAELVTDPRLDEFAAMKTEVPDACRDCEFFEFCKSGCPKHHVPIGTDPQRTNWFCEGYKMFFREALPELERMAEYIQRGELPPLKAPRAAAPDDAERRARFQAGPPPDSPMPLKASARKAPGRNDPCPCGSGRKYKRCCGRGL